MKNINFLLLLMESGILYHGETLDKNDAFYFTKSNKEHHFGVLNLPELAPLRRRCRFEWRDNIVLTSRIVLLTEVANAFAFSIGTWFGAPSLHQFFSKTF